MKILLVEDHPEAGALIRPLLEKKFSAVVTELRTIQSAIEVMEDPHWDKPDVVVCDYRGPSVSLMKFMLGFCQKVPCIFVVDENFPFPDLYMVGGVLLMEPVYRERLSKELLERIAEVTQDRPVVEVVDQKHKLAQIIANEQATEAEMREAAADSLEVVKDLSEKLGFTPQVQNLAMKSVELSMKLIGKSPRLSAIAASLKKNEQKYLSSHSIMLAEICCAIACKVGWHSAPTFLKLTLSAYLHDIVLKDNEMAKCRTLDEARNVIVDQKLFNDFKMHTARAAEFARRFHEIPPDVDVIINQHHEKPDGSGFPRGLVHKQIAPLSCLFIVAEDMLHFFLENEKKATIEDFVAARGELYQQGGFLKILKGLSEPAAVPKAG